MCTVTITERNHVAQKDQLRTVSAQLSIKTVAAKPDIVMHRGECSVYGCNCRGYVGANVGTCENCGHHYDSHRY